MGYLGEGLRVKVAHHIVPLLGKVTVQGLDPRRIDAFTRALAEKGVANRTSQYSYSVLRRALQSTGSTSRRTPRRHACAPPSATRCRNSRESADSDEVEQHSGGKPNTIPG
jgi:hypothetical protein